MPPGCPLSTRSTASLLGSGNCPHLAHGHKALDLRKIPPTEMLRSERGPSWRWHTARGPDPPAPVRMPGSGGFLWDQGIGRGQRQFRIMRWGRKEVSSSHTGNLGCGGPGSPASAVGPWDPTDPNLRGVWGQEETSSSAWGRPIFLLGSCVQCNPHMSPSKPRVSILGFLPKSTFFKTNKKELLTS